MSRTEEIIIEAFGPAVVAWSVSSVDGSQLVEVREFGRINTHVASTLARRILAHKKRILAGRVF